LIITVNTYLFKYVPVKLGFIILSLIGVLRIPEEFYLYKDKDKDKVQVHRTNNVTQTVVPLESLL
jgi:putative Mn2+ efflux pump MntP